MTNEELTTELYKKLFSEQKAYKEWLTKQPPEEILNHAYEYIIREDIIMAMEYLDLNDKQAKALINATSPLNEIFHDFVKIEDDHMDTVRECIENRANKTLKLSTKRFAVFPCISSLRIMQKNTVSLKPTVPRIGRMLIVRMLLKKLFLTTTKITNSTVPV